MVTPWGWLYFNRSYQWKTDAAPTATKCCDVFGSRNPDGDERFLVHMGQTVSSRFLWLPSELKSITKWFPTSNNQTNTMELIGVQSNRLLEKSMVHQQQQNSVMFLGRVTNSFSFGSIKRYLVYF